MAASAHNIIACFALFMSILALQVPFPACIDQRGTSAGTSNAAGTATASASAPPHLFDDGGALKKAAMLALLAGMDALFIAAAFVHRRHTRHAAVGAGGGGGNWRRVAELAFFVLCLQVGVLQFVLLVQLEPAAAGDAAAARALGIGTSAAAAHALSFVASVTFFLGITLIYAHAHVVGNRGGAVAGNGPVPPQPPATVRLLADMTLGAAVVCLMTVVLASLYINTK